MNAKEAQELTQKTIAAKNGDHLLPIIKRKISAAIRECKFSIVDPLSGERLHIEPAQEKAAYEALRAEGYKVTNHPGNPDSEDQRECASHIEISWRQ